MVCYNCGELGHLVHQCSKPKKDKYKKKYKDKKDDSSDDNDDSSGRTGHTRRMTRRKNFIRRRRMTKLILLVIGSRTLKHLVAHPMIKAMMRRRRWPPL
jgi:hypothetical protein